MELQGTYPVCSQLRILPSEKSLWQESSSIESVSKGPHFRQLSINSGSSAQGYVSVLCWRVQQMTHYKKTRRCRQSGGRAHGGLSWVSRFRFSESGSPFLSTPRVPEVHDHSVAWPKGLAVFGNPNKAHECVPHSSLRCFGLTFQAVTPKSPFVENCPARLTFMIGFQATGSQPVRHPQDKSPNTSRERCSTAARNSIANPNSSVRSSWICRIWCFQCSGWLRV